MSVSVVQCDIDSRPSFNRTPIGWVCNEESSYIPLTLEPISSDGETEDLWEPYPAGSCSLYLTQFILYCYCSVENICQNFWVLAAMKTTANTFQHYLYGNVKMRCKYSYVPYVTKWSHIIIWVCLKMSKNMNMPENLYSVQRMIFQYINKRHSII